MLHVLKMMGFSRKNRQSASDSIYKGLITKNIRQVCHGLTILLAYAETHLYLPCASHSRSESISLAHITIVVQYKA
jgi:hypothetical protein